MTIYKIIKFKVNHSLYHIMNNFFSWINKKEKREKAKELESRERSKVEDARERKKKKARETMQ